MSHPKEIKSSRRHSMAKLAKLPLSTSPIPPSPRHSSKPGLYLTNAPFLKRDDSSRASDDEPGIENETNFSAGIKDARIAEVIAKHLKADDPALTLEGADITRDIYKLSKDTPRPRRSKSWSLVDYESGRRGSSASSLNVPGGFRRQFIVANAHKRKPNFLTRNFVEFLSVYGHFAGEELEDDDDVACHYEPVAPFGLDEDVPLLQAKNYNPRGTATDSKAYFLLLKAFVGTGVLFLPKAFSSGGLVFSSATLFLFGLLSYWCYAILVQAKVATKVASFGDIGLLCYGPWLQNLILMSIVLSQVGFVAAYIVFTAENMRAFLCNVSSYKPADMDIFWFILLEAVVLTPITLIRDITKLSLLALLANLFIFIGLITILAYTMLEFIGNNFQPGEGVYFWFNKSEFSLFVGVAIFAFEGIGLILPIQESMIYPSHFPKVLFQVMTTISFVLIFIGAIGYLTYGANINTVILLNLPQNSPAVIMIQLLYAAAILLSTPIQVFPAVRLIELKIFAASTSGRTSLVVKWQKNLLRFMFVLGTATIALYGGQNLDKFVSFVGCFACIPLVYMYPPMVHLKACCDYKNATLGKKTKFFLAMLDYVLVAIGAVTMVYTTYDILRH